MGPLICWKLINNHFKKIKYCSLLCCIIIDTLGKYLCAAILKIKHSTAIQLLFACSLRIVCMCCCFRFYPPRRDAYMRPKCRLPAIDNTHTQSPQENKWGNYFLLSSLDSYFLMVLQETTKMAIPFAMEVLWKTIRKDSEIVNSSLIFFAPSAWSYYAISFSRSVVLHFGLCGLAHFSIFWDYK